MVLVLQALVAVAVNTALVTVVWLRHRALLASWFFAGMLVLRSAIAIDAQILHPAASSFQEVLALAAVRWGMVGVLQGLMLFFFVAIYEPEWLRRKALVIPAALVHAALSAALAVSALRSNDHLLAAYPDIHAIDHGAVQTHGLPLALFVAGWMVVMGIVGRAMIREPAERRPLALVLATMIAASVVGAIATRMEKIGYASILFDLFLSGLLAYLLFRRHVFETTRVAIDKALISMDEGIAVVSAAGRVLFANPTMERRGIVHMEGSPHHVPDPSEHLRSNSVTKLFRRQVGTTRAETEVVRGDRIFALSASPIHDDAGRLHGHLLLARDMTEARAYQLELERRNAELERAIRTQEDAHRARVSAESAKAAAEASSHAKTAFLANMSHELRTPLNAILGFVQLLEADESMRATQREHLAIIRKNGDQLLTMINRVLETSRAELLDIVARGEPVSAPRSIPPVAAPDLARLPDLLRAELREAANQLNTKAVMAVLHRIREKDEALADALGKLVSAYRFDTVLSLLEQPPKVSSG